MKKLISSLVITIALLLNIAPLQAEQTPIVTFDGTTSLKYNVDVNEFGNAFLGMVPSESRTLNIQLNNDSSKEVEFYMSTQVLKAFEDASTATKGAYRVSLVLNQDDKKTLIYGDEDGALIGSNEKGLYDLNGALNDKYMVAKIKANQKATISLTIALDGTVANGYQGLPSLIQFDFTAQYQDSQSNVIINKIINTKYIDSIITKVKTGDSTTITILAVALVGAASMIALLVRKGGKKHEK